ncbi:MAG: glutamyl-tRNA reductase [Bacillota bacterium]|nr:glutamyl-tRNA reductase [Bacillota bacterium]
MYILLAGVNHRTAPIEIREKFSFSEADIEMAYNILSKKTEIEGAVILTTCNRTEVYATTRDIESGQVVLRDFLATYTGLENRKLERYLYQPTCFAAIEHLFRVSAGLDSMIIGETQILGQLKGAYIKAWECNASDSVLNHLFQKALYVGKKVRSETAIDQHPVSISYASVELAQSLLGTLKDKTVLVIGTGETGELTTRYLLSKGLTSVMVSNRSFEKAKALADEFGGRAIQLNAVFEELSRADIVISCTAANHYVIRQENAREVLINRQGKKILFIDIAVPRDIDPTLADIEGVYIYDIDRLQDALDGSYEERKAASAFAEKIIKSELAEFNQWLASLYVVPVVTALKGFGERVKQNELQRAFNRLGKVSEREQKVITDMSSAIVNQLLRNPVVNLKDMAVSNDGHLYAELTKKLFGLNAENEEKSCDESFKAGYKGE